MARAADNPGLSGPPLRSLVLRPPLTVLPGESARNTLLLMNQTGGDGVVVTSEDGTLPLGLVTLRDLVHAITFESYDLDEPVAGVMIGGPLTMPADAPPHRARVLMAKRRVHHLVLTEADGSLCNLLTQSDLYGLRTGDTERLVENIAAARNMRSMALAADEVRQRGAQLFRGGMAVERLTEWMSGLNDLVGMRIIELIEDEFDLPGVPWCWVLFGSEGRLEQTFATDQDNGLIFQPPNEQDTESIRQRFLPFCQEVNRALSHCGFRLCPGDIMAGNPQWCLSAREWREQFQGWMETPEPQAILKSTIFFDFRPLYGSFELVDQLRTWLCPLPAKHPRFLRCMAEQALECKLPLGLGGRFVYQRDRNHRHTIDLKRNGSRPFVDIARLWSLAQGVWATNTADRLAETAGELKRGSEETAAAIESFHLVQRFRMRQQLVAEHPDAANLLAPRLLNELQQLMLKEAFKQARILQLRVKQDFGF